MTFADRRKGWAGLALPVAVGACFATSIVFAALMFVPPPEVGVARGVLSGVMLAGWVLIVWWAMDTWVSWRPARCVTAALACALGIFAVLDAYIVAHAGLHVVDALQLLSASGSWTTTLREAGYGPWLLWLAVVGLALVMGLAACWRLVSNPPSIPKRGQWALMVGLAVLTVGFTAEQYDARATVEFRYRDRYLPLYPTLFPIRLRHRVEIPVQTDAEYRRQGLEHIGPAQNPRHVLFIVLESFRRDAINPVVTPNLARLEAGAVTSPNARTEGIFTLTAWNPMLMNRPAITAAGDQHRIESADTGSLPFLLLKKAGYRVQVALSTDPEYGHYRTRMLGQGGAVDETYLPYGSDPEAPRWVRDLRVTERAQRWIEALDPSQPTFMLLQLDGTHWTYTFDPSDPLHPDYDREPDWGRQTVAEAAALARRYENAAHGVDRNVGRLLDALRSRGLQDDVAIVVLSDHGELVGEGGIGHSTFHPDVLAIPLFLSLPGQRARALDLYSGTADAMATLLGYLDIQGFEPWMVWGSSLLRPDAHPGVVLTANGSQSRFMLSTPQGSVELRSTGRIGGSAGFMVKNAFDTRGRPVADVEAFVGELRWRETLDRLLHRPRRPL